ncbi:alpha/beta fold hydrolase [uncultured Sphingomonas sp.]|uniref:alpha/beta hydrolase n=2 Tax=Sphingomonas TaxID=13687 RepID=UPI0015755E6A
MASTALGLGACWVAGSIMTAGHNSRVVSATSPSEDIRLETQDGVSIAATFTPGRNDRSPAVLLLHGVGASRQATAANAGWLASLGYATLTIDFRGHGQSGIKPRTFGLNEALDAQTAFAWLKHRQHHASVAIIGISLGGAASLLGDDGPIPADALILQAVYPDIRQAIRNRIASRTSVGVGYLFEPLLSYQAPLRFGAWPSRLSPLKALPRYRGPVLVIGGEQDRSTPPSETRAMFAAAPGRKELWLVPFGDHADICDLASPAYRRHVEAFLLKTIGRPANTGSEISA